MIRIHEKYKKDIEDAKDQVKKLNKEIDKIYNGLLCKIECTAGCIEDDFIFDHVINDCKSIKYVKKL